MVDAQRQKLLAATIDLAPTGMLGLLHRDAPLGLRDQDRPGNDEQERAGQEQDMTGAKRALAAGVVAEAGDL
jgi:hypothetical protein